MKPPLKLAAAAPAAATDDDAPAQTDRDNELHALCEAWVSWMKSRRLYGAPRPMPSLLGRLRTPTRASASQDGPGAPCSAELAAFHLAYCRQPETLHKVVFAQHYLHRPMMPGRRRPLPIKTAAAALGISRAQWYALLAEFRMRTHADAQDLLAENAAQRAALLRSR